MRIIDIIATSRNVTGTNRVVAVLTWTDGDRTGTSTLYADGDTYTCESQTPVEKSR